MDIKNFLNTLGFKPKENTSGLYYRNYYRSNNYIIEVDLENEYFNFGDKINVENKTTQNFSQAENWVVLECVNRLLEKGYPPQNITLEKTWATGHGTSGRLDILVTRDDSCTYLMIECKTWGNEFDKEFKNLKKNGGQLFTYFQQDKNADILMLYASKLDRDEIKYKNEIVKIEKDYRQTGNVKDFYERWNKLPKSNGVFDNWASVYAFQSKALTKNDLKELKHEDSSFIFNRFLEILRHNVVSDKPNAFNKIFTLFLCKIVDENRNEGEQLHFQWLEGGDNHISFQKRLTDLYNRGMLELLEKKVTDVSDSEFDKQFLQVEEKYRDKFKEILTEIRLKKNNEFAIKEVYDDASFEENAKVVKEVVELLQVYQIRYNYRQQFLSDFFELLLTTGLKQESGQFFTPVPIARFIIKSLPLQKITKSKIEKGNTNDLLPTIIDYAAGSGHFVTESMEEVQKNIDDLDESSFNPSAKRSIKKWKDDQFDWAEKYVYAIEKDYRLVKTTKVSCYLHGDGLAKVIHGDGLGDFATSTEFKDLLKETDKTYSQDNKQFDIVISNPPYSVSAFKGLMDEKKSTKGFDLYKRLTDQSSEIECLFIERTKQLLKDGGVAGIVLPSSILSNAGIYAQTREIILKYFDVMGIVELGSNTFMATGMNTVILFLKRRNNADAFNIKEAIKKLFINQQDVTINEIEMPLQKYIAHVWEDITFEDYKTLLQKFPNDTIKNHEIFKEYDKKIITKNKQEKWEHALVLEQEKLLYFILTLPQRIVLIKTGEKNKEKAFLGYEFSNRRGSEGIHPINRSKPIDDCTQLYDANTFENPEKASTYIYKAFNGNVDLEIDDSLKENVSYQNLVDMLTFDRVGFEKNISLSIKKKVKIESKWEQVFLNNAIIPITGNNTKIAKSKILNEGKSPVITQERDEFVSGYTNEKKTISDFPIILFGDHSCTFKYIDFHFLRGADGTVLLKPNNKFNAKYFYYFLKFLGIELIHNKEKYERHFKYLKEIKIPLPPLNIQKKIVAEIEVLEKQEQKAVEELEKLKDIIRVTILSIKTNLVKLGDIFKYNTNTYSPKNNPEKSFVYVDIQSVGKNTGKINYSQKIIGKTAPSRARRKANKDDFIISSVRPNLKGFAFIDKDVSECIFSTGFFIVTAKKENIALNKFGYYLFMYSQEVLDQMISKMDKAQYPNINSKDFDNIKIPLPPLKEQKQIVTDIEKIEKKIADLEKKIAAIPKQKESILKKYLE